MPASHMRLDGKVALITGGAQGVGLGIAQEFVDYGATVIVADINETTLKEAATTLGPDVTPSSPMSRTSNKCRRCTTTS
jgi:NAD(P)-dependent dehydrogenase (short-subunit alcohol dehydrogenase family)